MAESKPNIYGKLLKIQTELKAPKGQWNDFSNFKYRSCEDILEAIKPLLKDTSTIITISDELQKIGDRYYVMAIATLTDTEAAGAISVTAYAREQESKKGMDASQITGAASSYARKYALNGLFAIDDTKDADTGNNKDVPAQKQPQQRQPQAQTQGQQTAGPNVKIEPAKINLLKKEVERIGMTDEQFLKNYKKNSYGDFTQEEWLKLYPALQKIK